MANTNETMMITIPSPMLVLHKVGGGEVALDRILVIMSVSETYIFAKYFLVNTL